VTMQVAIDLTGAEHDAFNRWLASTAVAVSPDDPHLDAGEAIRAMIRVTMRYTDITSQVTSQVRLERAAAKNPKAPPVITGAARLQRLDLDRRGGRVPALDVVTRSRMRGRGSYVCCRWRAVRVRRADGDDDPIRAPRPASAPRALWCLRCRDAWCAGDGGPGTRDCRSGDPCGS